MPFTNLCRMDAAWAVKGMIGLANLRSNDT